MISIETISIVFTGLSVSLAAFYYISTLRNANRMRELALESQELSRKAQEQALKAQEQALITRQAQLFMPIYNRFNQQEFLKTYSDITNVWEWKDYDDFNEKYGPNSNPEDYASFLVMVTYFEGVGVLVRRGLIDAGFVDDLLSGLIIRFWERYENYFLSVRELRGWPQFAEYVEYLYDVIMPIAERQHPELKT